MREESVLLLKDLEKLFKDIKQLTAPFPIKYLKNILGRFIQSFKEIPSKVFSWIDNLKSSSNDRIPLIKGYNVFKSFAIDRRALKAH